MLSTQPLYEAADWRSRESMARTLLRRHSDVSTVRAMIANHFGHAPSIGALERLRGRLGKPMSHGGTLSFTGSNAINFSTAPHEEAMERGSTALLKALWNRHQRVLLVAEAKGRSVVRP